MINNNYPSAEFELISELQKILGKQPDDIYQIGIGDDAAVRSSLCEKLVLTTDLSVENVHFSLKTSSLEEVGYRSMVSNLSDCAAMGAVPEAALVQVTFPKELRNLKMFMGELYKGFALASHKWKFSIIGGDLSSGSEWVIGITLLGKIPSSGRVLKRKGARDGDLLWITGFPGRSAAGLEIINRWKRSSVPEHYTMLVQAHLSPVPRIETAIALAQRPEVHAMMDLSDGLSKDCRTLSFENKLGIVLKFDTTLVPNAMIQLGDELNVPWQEWFLHGGEDYELLFAASPDFNPFCLDVNTKEDIINIGRFTSEHCDLMIEENSSLHSVPENSWDHVRRALL